MNRYAEEEKLAQVSKAMADTIALRKRDLAEKK